VKLAFYVAAALMLAVALALVVVPLVRHGRRQGRPRGIFVLVLASVFILPLATIGIYLLVGTPQTIAGVPKAVPPPTIDDAIAALRARLAQHPEDTQGWLLMGQADIMLGKPTEARAAYERALALDAKSGVAMVGWAEADSQAAADHLIAGRARQLLEQAVAADPKNQKALWLLGISDVQQGKDAEAVTTWRQLQPMLDPDSNVAAAVAQQIAAAEKRATAGAPAAASGGPQLRVEVTLDPALKHKVSASDTVFVFARAENGPPMPLAVARLKAGELPTTVTLTDAMAMTPQLRLSTVPKVFVAARVSRSGQAVAQAGDLEGDAGVVATDGTALLHVIIDKVH
jgi:cytochrome c-type biogenesis protein CcmH